MKKNAAIWHNKNFLKLFIANALANLGNWFDFIAVLILFRYIWKADPILIALVPVMYAIPSIILGQYAGVFADQRDKLKILYYSDWIRAGFTLFIVFPSSPFLVLPILFLRSTAGVFSLPAQQGLMRNIVNEADISWAVTINGSLFQFVKVVGPMIGGTLTGIFSPNIPIIFNAICFFFSGFLLTRIKLKKNQDSMEKEERNNRKIIDVFSSWKKGWHIVLKNNVLLASISFGIASTLTIQMLDAQLVTLFSEVFPENVELTGWVISSIGIGSLIVVSCLYRLEKIDKYGWLFGMGSLFIGLMALGYGFLGEYNFLVFAIALAFVGGIGNGMTFITMNYLVQKEPPKEAVGRVYGIVDSTLSILFIVGPLIGGALITQYDILSVFKMIGVTLIIIGLTGILLQKFIWKQATDFASRRDLKGELKQLQD